MRSFILIFTIAGGVLLGSLSAPARTIIHAPTPDVRLFLPVPPEKMDDLRRTLLDFAAQEQLSEFKDAPAPRAKGKQFFLSLNSDRFSFVFEKSVAARSLMVECYDRNSSFSREQAKLMKVPYETESPFGKIVARLKQRLKTVSSDVSEER
jgi:hypothetical protein